MILPPEAAPLLAALLPELTRPAALRFTALLAAALLTTGCRAVANLLRTLRHLAVLVRLPFTTRPWALPILVGLYRSAEDGRQRRRPHRTPARLMRRPLRLALMRIPNRCFIFVGDGGYGTHEAARFCHKHRARLTPVSRLHPEANLYEPPRRTRARAGRASRAGACPSRARRWRQRSGCRGGGSGGTAAARGGWAC